MNPLLKLLELPYRGINRIRRALYRAGILRGRKLHHPVVSIGNIAAGGSGKTPAIISIARFIASRGCRAAVLTRGYGRTGEGGAVTDLDPERYGDEPVLIKKSVDNVIVMVGHNRYENGLRTDCDIYLLDDGFQHLQLERDLDIVIESPVRHFAREGRSALRDADLVIPRQIRPAGLEALAGKRVFAFSGLADNEQFVDMLRSARIPVAGARGFRDHHTYRARDIASIRAAASAASADAIVTTEKDAVKVRQDDMIAVAIEFIVPDEVLDRIAALLPK